MQNTLITREVINKNIKYGGIGSNNTLYDYDYLCKEIDRFKNILQHNNAQTGQSVFNFLKGIKSVALFFASSELGLVTCVIDICPKTHQLYFQKENYLDAKSKSVMPINFVFLDKISIEKLKEEKSNKQKLYSELAEKVIVYDEHFDCSYNDTINAVGDSILIKSCSSGTTGTPKSISHSHSFICKVAKRNSKSFYGSVMCTRIFHHGSSFATFFLPTILSDRVDCIYYSYDKAKYRQQEDYLKIIDHIQFPYPTDIKEFFKKTPSLYPQLNVYTLAKIHTGWKKHLGKKVKDIISLFGSSETSGPIFTQHLSDENFEQDRFIDPDGWYDPKIIDGKLNLTGDRFEYNDDGSYKFLGRDDIVTIQGQQISLQEINYQAKKHIGYCHVTIDTVYDKVYLCIWNDEDDLSDEIEKFRSLYSLVFQTKFFSRIMDNKFLCGIKIDNEAIRDHFRWLT